MNPATAEAGLITLLTSGFGLTTGKVEWAFQNPTRPAAPFVSVERIAFRPIGRVARGQADAPLPQTPGREIMQAVRQTCTIEYRLNYYGPQAFWHTAPLLPFLKSEASLHTLQTLELAVWNVSSVQSLPKLFKSTYEDRAVVDIVLGAYLTKIDYFTWIEHVSGTATITDADVSTTFPWSVDLTP
jgi:hypothetical protein